MPDWRVLGLCQKASPGGDLQGPFWTQVSESSSCTFEKLTSVRNGRADDTAAPCFRDKAIPMGTARPLKVLAPGTRPSVRTVLRDSVCIFETGCLAETPEYDAGPKLMGAPRPPALGDLTLVQEDGETNMNETRWVSIQDVPQAMEAAA